MNALHNATCTHGHVQEYVTKWRNGISYLQSTKYSFNVKTCITLFVRGLPLIAAFTSLYADLPDHIEIMSDTDLSGFMSLMDLILTLDIIFRSASQSQVPHPACSTTAVTPPVLAPMSAPILPSAVVSDPSTCVSKPILTCSNCKSHGLHCVGHTDATCFQPGGGMEDHHEEYLNNKGHIHAMFTECLECFFTVGS